MSGQRDLRVNWEGLTENDEKLRDFTRRLIALRATQPLLRRENWRDGLEIRWFNAGGGPQQSEQWDEGSTLGLAISRPDLEQEEGVWQDVLMLFNPFEGTVPFQIPQFGEGVGCSNSRRRRMPHGEIITESVDYELAGRSITLFRRP